MRFTGWHIDGFGVFCNLDVSGLSPGLNVFAGKNESGKTTLLAFLRTMLFGFPPGQRRENLYPPLSGGRHGGRLHLIDNEGNLYVVSRYYGPKRGPVTVLLPDGSEGGEEILRQLTGAATEDLFRSVFAFSLNELQRFESLNSQAVRAAIYSAGTGVGQVSLAAVEKKLQGSLGNLFKPGGKKPVINQLFKELGQVEQAIKREIAEVDLYDTLCLQLVQSAERVEVLEEKLRRKRQRLERLKLLEAGWEHWVAMEGLRERLADLPEIEDFPEDGIHRLERLQERKQVLQPRQHEMLEKIKQLKEKLHSIPDYEKWLAAAEAIRLLERGFDSFVSSRKELLELRLRLKKEREALAEDLRALGPEWNLARISEFDRSIEAKEKVRRFQEELNIVRQAKQGAEQSREHARKSVAEMRIKVLEADRTLAQMPEPPMKEADELWRRHLELRSLRNILRSRQELRQRWQHLRERVADFRGQQERLQERLAASRWLPLWSVAIVVLVAAAVTGTTAWYGDLAAGLLAAIGGLILSGCWLAVVLWQRRQQKAQVEQTTAELLEVARTLDTLTREEKHCQARVEARERELRERCLALGLSGNISREEIDKMEVSLKAAQELLQQWQRVRDRCQEMKADLERCQEELSAREEALSRARNDLQAAEGRWGHWLQQMGLATDLSPSSTLEVMERVRTLWQQARNLADLEERERALAGSVSSYEKMVLAAAKQVGVESGHAIDIEPMISRMIHELEQAVAAQQSSEQISEALRETSDELARIETQLSEVDRELHYLFTEGGCSEEKVFRQRARVFEERSRVVAEIRHHLSSLENLGGRGPQQQAFQDELRQTSLESLRSEREQKQREVTALENEIGQLREQLGRLDERKQRLETAEELALLRQKRSELISSLTEAAREWSVLALGLHFLRRARQVYETERKQPVVRESEKFFRTITGGRYKKILAPSGEERIRVMQAGGKQNDLLTLSRGTAEQLYLSLRFGYIKEFGRRARPLPVVMDDILVNFDPERAAAAARAMFELASENQILFFTCHPETVALIRNLDDSVSVWQLQEGECLSGDHRQMNELN
ncbi:MAG: AAA family ATPase [Deltaproteobacteria bacterium]|nr:AAA family ATPase [Deltaproteobacteria bacterium]